MALSADDFHRKMDEEKERDVSGDVLASDAVSETVWKEIKWKPWNRVSSKAYRKRKAMQKQAKRKASGTR